MRTGIATDHGGFGLKEELVNPRRMPMTDENTVQLAINTIRTLCMDAVQQANSGHPGTPMGMAPVAYCLWQRFLRFDPEHPIWPNRDRFVLSVGHASALLYALLHLTGVKAVNPKYEVLGELSVPLEDLKRFRQYLAERARRSGCTHLPSAFENAPSLRA